MKAVALTAYGGIDRFVLRELPEPRPGPGAIAVRVAGASINPIDWKIRSGAAQAYFPVEFPAILGRDASGEVAGVGAGVTGIVEGDRVLGLVVGAYAEVVVAPVDAWAKVPAGLDLVDAGALPLVLLTGAQLIEEAVRPAPGDVLVVTGAVGSVGRTAVFAAKKLGARVWAGVRASQRAEAESLGVDGVVALDADDMAKLPRLAAVADTVGGDAIAMLYGHLKPGGVIGSTVGEPAGAKERGFRVHAFMTHTDSTMLARYATAVAEKRLVIPIAKRLRLEDAGKAQALAESHPGGKILLSTRSTG